MTSGQKVAFSLLISVLAFCAFTVIAFSGLFDLIEVNFYQPVVQEIKHKKIQEIAAAQNEYFDTLMRRFDNFTVNSDVKTYVQTHPNDSSVRARELLRSQLVTTTPALKGLRIIDANGRNVYFSTFSSDVISSRNGIAYRDYDKSDEVAYDSVMADSQVSETFDSEKKCRIIKDGEHNFLIFSLPFFDAASKFKATALFYCDASNFSQFLFNKNLIDINGFASLVTNPQNSLKKLDGFGGFVFGMPNYGISSIQTQLLEKWKENETESFWKLEPVEKKGTENMLESRTLCAFSYRQERADYGFLTFLYEEDELKFPPFMRLLLLATAFITLYLAIFLIFSFRHDDIVVIRDKVHRFENEFFIAYKKMGTANPEYLAEQKPVLERRILKSLGKKGAKHASEFKSIFESYWQEMLSSFGLGTSYAQIGYLQNAPQINAEELKEIVRSSLEDILETKKIESGKLKIENSEESAEEKDLPLEESEPENVVVEDVETADAAEPIEEIEEVAEAEVAEPIEEVEEVESAEEPDGATEQAGETESVEEIEPVEEINSVEEIESAEAVEELADDAEEAEPLEEVEELEEESEPIEEIEELADELEEVEPVEDVEELADDAEPVEDIEELAEDVETAEEAEELEEAEAVEELADEVESADEIEEVEEVEELADDTEVFEELQLGDGRLEENETDDAPEFSASGTIDSFQSLDEDDEELEILPEYGEQEERADDLKRTLSALPEKTGMARQSDDDELGPDGLSRKYSWSEMHDFEKLHDAVNYINEMDSNLEELESFDTVHEEPDELAPIEEAEAAPPFSIDEYIPKLLANSISADDDIYKDEALLEKIEFGVPSSDILDNGGDDSVAENFVAYPLDYSFLDDDDTDEVLYKSQPQNDITESEHYFKREKEEEIAESSDDKTSVETVESGDDETLAETEEVEPIDGTEAFEEAESIDDAEELEAVVVQEEDMPFMFTKLGSVANVELTELSSEIDDAIVQDDDGTFRVTALPSDSVEASLDADFKKLVDSILR